MPIYVITLMSMTMCSIKISAFSINHWVTGVVVTVFLNCLTVKFLNSILARNALLLCWKNWKSMVICEVIELNLDKQPTSTSLCIWKSKRWNSVLMQEVNPSAKCTEVQCMLDGSTCWKQSVITRQSRYVCVSVSTAILTISDKKVTSRWQHCLIYPGFEIFSVSWHA